MPAPTHMNFADRKAFAVLAAYLESTPDDLPAQSGDLEAIYEPVQRAAERMASASDGAPLDSAVQAAAALAAEAALPFVRDKAVARETLERFQSLVRGISCSTCGVTAACKGAAADDALVANGGQCMRQIHDAFDWSMRQAKATYAASRPAGPPVVDVSLQTRGISDPPAGVPGGLLAANGVTSYVDSETEKRSLIRVDIAALAIDRSTLAALPYILLHEVLCHAFQMSDAPGPRPGRKAVVDPISEGMMDAIAVRELTRNAQALLLDPALSPRARATANVAMQVHAARRSLDLDPPFKEAPAVARGVEALELVEAVYGHLGLEEPQRLAERLACEMNLHPWSYADRFFAMTKLVHAVRESPRDLMVFELLEEFASGGDARPLVSYLTRT